MAVNYPLYYILSALSRRINFCGNKKKSSGAKYYVLHELCQLNFNRKATLKFKKQKVPPHCADDCAKNGTILRV